MWRSLGFLALLGTSLIGTPASVARAQQVEHTFIMVIDGLRSTEAFDDPQLRFVYPLMELAPQGTLLKYIENRGQTTTLPAHQVFVTGNYADYGNSPVYEGRTDLAPRTPTLFEAYRQFTGAPRESCWVVSNTPLLNDSTHGLMPGYGLDRGAVNACEFSGSADDAWSWSEVYAAIDEHEVALMMVNLHETDRMGHAAIWNLYTGKAEQASLDLVDFWNFLQAHPTYQDNTLLIVTTDHGRHLEGIQTGWIDHGCDCRGCRKCFALWLGPGIKQDLVTSMPCSLLDVAPTVAHLMGLPFPYSRGRVLTEILEDGAVTSPGSGAYLPKVAGTAELLVRVSELQDNDLLDDEGAHQVLVELSEDLGETWDAVLTDDLDVLQRSPVAWTDGEVVLVAWLEIHVKGEPWAVRVRRLDLTGDGWEEVFEEEMVGSSTPVSNISLTLEGEQMVLAENNPRNERIRIWTSDDRGSTWMHELAYEHVRHFPRDLRYATVGGARVMLYSAHTQFMNMKEDPNENTEIYWLRSEDDGETWDGEFALTDEVRPSIQPVVAVTPDDVLHVVWADLRGGTFQLYHSESTDDGVSFSAPVQLTDAPVGAWEPTLAVDGEALLLVWTQIDASDQSEIRQARIEAGQLVDEQTVSTPGVFARTPHLLPLGDCTALVTWSGGGLTGPWEIASEWVDGAGFPVTSTTAELAPEEVVIGEETAVVELSITLQIEPGDRGMDRIEVAVPEPFEPMEGASLVVDGAEWTTTETIDGQAVWLDLENSLAEDGAELTLALPLVPPAEVTLDAEFAVVLHSGQSYCTVEIDGTLQLDAVEPEDETQTPPSSDDDAGNDCACRVESTTGPGPAALLLALLSLVLLARCRR